MADFDIKGDDFIRFSKALKQAGRTELRKELHKGMRDAGKPLAAKAQEALADATPARLDSRASRTKHVVKVKTGKDPGLTIGVPYGQRGAGLGASNAQLLNRTGEVRHPLYGDRGHWFNTKVPGAQGWFDESMRRNAPGIQPDLEAALQRVIDKIIRDAK